MDLCYFHSFVLLLPMIKICHLNLSPLLLKNRIQGKIPLLIIFDHVFLGCSSGNLALTGKASCWHHPKSQDNDDSHFSRAHLRPRTLSHLSWYAIINCTALVAKLYWFDTDWVWKIEMLYFWYDFPFSHFDTSLHCRTFREISMEFPVLIAEIPGDTKRHFYAQIRKSYLPLMSSLVTGCK